MELEIVPEDDNRNSRLKNTSLNAIGTAAATLKAKKNPWKGKFNRRRKPRDGDEIFSVPLKSDGKNTQKPEPE